MDNVDRGARAPHESVDRGFRVAHQKVSIDVDLANTSICGWTELTIIPTDLALEKIVLDCRHSQIHNVLVNGKKATVTHEDRIYETNMPSSSSVYQHHLYSKEFDGLLKASLQGELTINLPKGTKIVRQEETDASATSSLASLPGVSPGTTICQPLMVKIDFSSFGSSSGFRFVGGLKSNLKRQFWHAYTTHDPIGQSTSSWLPCVDGLWELSTWELEVSVQSGNELRMIDRAGKIEKTQDENNDNDNDNEKVNKNEGSGVNEVSGVSEKISEKVSEKVSEKESENEVDDISEVNKIDEVNEVNEVNDISEVNDATDVTQVNDINKVDSDTNHVNYTNDNQDDMDIDIDDNDDEEEEDEIDIIVICNNVSPTQVRYSRSSYHTN